MQPFEQSIHEVLESQRVDRKTGLAKAEVADRLQKYGDNKLKAKKKKTYAQRFLDQFKDVMILILLVAAAVSFVIALNGHDAKEFFEPVLILLIVVLNAIMGSVQESRAEKALDALQGMSAPHARVRRDGHEEVIDALQVVPGDIILVEAGDFIPADARILESASCKAEESALTGESVPSEKQAEGAIPANAPIGDRLNMLYSGCSVTYGRAEAVVTATGMDTEMGKIAGLLDNETDAQTPLQQKLAQLGKYLGIVALAACVVVFIVGLLDGIPVMEIFMTAVSLAVSAIPEGLPVIVTIVLSIGVQRMVKRNALIRRLPAVETLGSASVICSDKTGTLTQNRMALVSAYAEKTGDEEAISSQNTAPIKELLQYATLCCDGSVEMEDGKEKHIGDPTETAIVLAARNNGMTKEQLGKDFPRLAEIPFDSDRKRMSVVCRIGGKNMVIVKGAFDTLAGHCTSGDLDKAKTLVEQLSGQALRVLAIGTKEIGDIPEKPSCDQLEEGLAFMGLVGMIDPPRPEAREAVRLCRKAGIKPVMITGDHVVTASAIAKDLEIQLADDRAITGTELAAMSDAQLAGDVRHIAVYARVSPEDKIRIVKAWQKQGEVVSMTGDGVNDAPALKAADIGCAMGITGTDVAKGAADMTLTDDNFATIVEAVREGRGIYDNIKKVVGFLLGTNIGEVLTVFFSMLFWRQSPLVSMQLLWINLVTDSFPAVALGMEAVEPDIMERQPKPKNEGIFAHGMGVRVVLQGVMFAALSMLGFWIGWRTLGIVEGGRTMAFLVLALSQIVHSFNMRSNHSLFKIGVFTNKKLNGAALLSLVLVLLVAFIPPAAMAFGLTQLPVALYLAAAGLALVPVAVLEISKITGLVRHHHG